MITEKQVFAALPKSGFLRAYVEWASQWIEANASFQVATALSLLAQSVPTTMFFPGIPKLRANFFALLVGPSSASGKTRSIEAAKSVLQDSIPSAEMTQPGSPQACLDALNGNPQILFYDEFGSFLRSTEVGQLGPLKLVLTDLYDCGKAGRHIIGSAGRKAKPPEPNPRLSVLAGVAPGLLEDHTDQTDWSEGFLGRFYTLFACSEREINRTDFDVGEADRLRLAEMLSSYKNVIDYFNAVTFQPCQGFTLGGSRVWNEWRASIRSRVASGDGAIKSAIHRAQGHCLKIALLLAWDYGDARSGQPWKIDFDIVETAIKFTEWHIESVEEIAADLAPDRDMKDERRMYKAIEETPILYSEALKKAKLVKKRADDMINSLIAKKLIYRVDESDLTAAIKYARVRQSNVIPFRGKKAEGSDDPPDPFGP